MPVVGRHGDLQGRVPRALLRGESATAFGENLRQHSRAGARASSTPRLANAIANAPSVVANRQAHVRHPSAARHCHDSRRAPFAHGSQRHHGSTDQTQREVVLFPDTFTNYFEPEVAIAATEVLERANFRVVIPKDDLCCGRPLYDAGDARSREAAPARGDGRAVADGRARRVCGRPRAELHPHLPRRIARALSRQPARADARANARSCSTNSSCARSPVSCRRNPNR